MVAGRTASKAQALAGNWGARWGTFREVAEFGDIALIAVRYQGMPSRWPSRFRWETSEPRITLKRWPRS